MCENSISTSSYLEYFVIRHQSQNLLYSITLQMNSKTLYPKWGLLKNTLHHISDNSKERMHSRTLVMIPIITLFASLCYFMNGLAKILILRKLHRRILLKNCTFQNFIELNCEFTEFFVLSFLSNYCLYPPDYLTLSLFIYACIYKENYLVHIYIYMCAPGSSVGIATDYGLDGSRSNSDGYEIFRPSRSVLGPTQSPVQFVPSLSRWQSVAGECC